MAAGLPGSFFGQYLIFDAAHARPGQDLPPRPPRRVHVRQRAGPARGSSSPPGTHSSVAERPAWVLFDLNGTLLDIASVAEPLGGDTELVEAAFQEALLHTMADSLSEAPYRPLPNYLRATLERRLQ